MNKLLRQSSLFLNRNSSTILTCIGGVGVIATSVLAVKATPKALTLLEAAKEEKGEELTNLEKIKVAGPVYIPSILTGISTLICIFGANALNKRQQAALTSAYALLDNSYKQYKATVKELYGEEADSNIRSHIAKDKYEEEKIETEDDRELFYDYFSGRYFRSTMADVMLAEYNLNRRLSTQEYVAVDEFYELLDIPGIEAGDKIGWSGEACFSDYWRRWIDFSHEKVVQDDGLECTIIVMHNEPVIGFDYYT